MNTLFSPCTDFHPEEAVNALEDRGGLCSRTPSPGNSPPTPAAPSPASPQVRNLTWRAPVAALIGARGLGPRLCHPCRKRLSGPFTPADLGAATWLLCDASPWRRRWPPGSTALLCSALNPTCCGLGSLSKPMCFQFGYLTSTCLYSSCNELF